MTGHAQRVPTKTGSVTELVSVLEKKVTADEVNQAMRQAADGNGTFGYSSGGRAYYRSAGMGL
ncbi:hypothetical protein ACLBWC_38170, partial [Pseudomonas aeruginosa]